MAAVARVRTMLEQQRVRKENEVQSAFAMFNRIETQPGPVTRHCNIYNKLGTYTHQVPQRAREAGGER